MQAAPAVTAEIAWRIDDNGSQQLSFQLSADYFVCPLLAPVFFIDSAKGRAGALVSACEPARLMPIALRPPLAPEEVADFNLEFAAPSGLLAASVLTVQLEPLSGLTARLDLFEAENAAQAKLYFVYNGQAIDSDSLTVAQDAVRFMRAGKLYQVQRDVDAERAIRRQLAGFVAAPSGQGLTLADKRAWLSFMLLEREALMRAGWQINIDERFPFRMALARDWYGDLSASPAAAGADQPQDWFSLELGIIVEGEAVNILPLLIEQLRQYSPEARRGEKAIADEYHDHRIDNQLLLSLGEGRYLPIPLERVQKILETLLELYDEDCLSDDNRLRLPRSQVSRLAQLAREAFGEEQEALAWTGEQSLTALAERLRDFDGIAPLMPPDGFQAELRRYQQEGLGWLQFLRQFRAGGILADDMGLGKTVQALAHLALEKAAGRLQRPALIISPTSLISNWRNEAARFAPHLKILALQGAQRKHRFEHMGEADLILTTYPLLNFDTEVLLAQDYSVLILDEAQTIKNPQARVSKIVRQLRAEHRLCLTGTPMENHLGELWSLFDFLQPGLLGDERSFQRRYRSPIELAGSEARAQALATRIAPFILRRNKERVATELPAKTEILRAIPLQEAQQDLYDSIRLTMHQQLRRIIKEQGFGRSQVAVLDALLKLRQVCCDPRLLDLDTARDVSQSAKLEALMSMLPELVDEGRRILLFSQFTSMLALIEQALAPLDIPWVKLTGQTRDRAAVVERFQKGEVPLFLISLKAGGTGLNLTAADTVIHYDPWWNPAAENQATDRAYRLGQDKPVFVYKLVTEGTVEEKILHLQKRKQALAASLYDAKTGSPTALAPDDLDMLLAPM